MTQLGDEVDPAVRPSGAGVAALPNLLTYARRHCPCASVTT